MSLFYFSSDGPSRGGTLRGGRGGRSRNEKLENFGFRNLQSMAEKDPDTLVLDMTSDKCLPALENLVSDFSMDDRKVVVVLRVFVRACECSTTEGSLLKLLNHLPRSTYMIMHLSNYINRMTAIDDVEEREDQFRMLLKLFNELLDRLPSSYADLPIAQLYVVTTILNSKGQLCDEGILSEVERLYALKEEMTEKVKQEDGEKGKKPRRRNQRDEGMKRSTPGRPKIALMLVDLRRS